MWFSKVCTSAAVVALCLLVVCCNATANGPIKLAWPCHCWTITCAAGAAALTMPTGATAALRRKSGAAESLGSAGPLLPSRPAVLWAECQPTIAASWCMCRSHHSWWRGLSSHCKGHQQHRSRVEKGVGVVGSSGGAALLAL